LLLLLLVLGVAWTGATVAAAWRREGEEEERTAVCCKGGEGEKEEGQFGGKSIAWRGRERVG